MFPRSVQSKLILRFLQVRVVEVTEMI